MSDLLRNILNQLALGGTESVTAEVLGSSLGLPPGTMITVTMVKGLVKGAAQTAVLSAYDDILKRQISKIETSNVNYTFEKAEKVFWELVDKEGVNAGYNFDDNSSEFDYALQVAEGVLMQSMREYEFKKLDVLGAFYGRSMYYGNTQWESIHHTLKMTDRLTYRQLVLIRLICEEFLDIEPELCITAPDACVETMDLITYGIWTTPGTFLNQDNSNPIPIKRLVPTEYAKGLTRELMLEKIPKDDIKKVLDTLNISKSNKVNEIFTVDDKQTINDSITWQGDALRKKADSDMGIYNIDNKVTQ